MIGLELTENVRERQSGNMPFYMTMLCEERGLHITYSYFEPVIRFIPPLTITKKEIDDAVGVLDEVLAVLEDGKRDVSSILPQNHRSGPFVRNMEGRFSTGRILKKIWDTPPKAWAKKIGEIF
jgi:hypothetical protein